ncbi:phospholipase, partial [Streptomyces bungoensis]
SFDATAGSLRGMFDFRHPNGKQVLLNTDGSVKSVGPIRHVASVATRITPGAEMENTAAETSRNRNLPAGLGAAALLAAGVTGTYLTVRRRRRA